MRLPALYVWFALVSLAAPAFGSAQPTNPGAAALQRTADGVTLHASTGTLHVAVCSDRVVHVVASATEQIPSPIVPVVIRPCGGAAFRVASDSSAVSIRTKALTVVIDRATEAVRFLSSSGQLILSEQPDGERMIAPATIDTTHTYQVQQKFLLSPGEALYGLGQHQEGLLNLRNIPIQLLQANTDIAIPFVVSTKGYGVLWDNPSLTDFDPATEPVQLDDHSVGSFRTGSAGEYGFLLKGNGTRTYQLSIDGQKIIDLSNMWVSWSAGAKMQLNANTTYNVVATTGGNTQLFLRKPSDTMAFSSQAGQAVDYYFMYGPEPSQVVAEYRTFTGSAPLLPRWAYGFWQCRERYSSQQQILDTAAKFRQDKIPVDVIVQDWQYWGKYGWNAMRFDESRYPDPKQMLSELHRQDLHMVISVWAKFGSQTAVDQEMAKDHLLLTSVASTGEPGEAKESENWADLFNPQAQKLFWSDIDDNLFSLGMDGWWLDASEPEGDPLKNDETFLGPGKLVRNAYPLYETSAVYQGQKAADSSKRVVILSRSAFAGQQRNGSISWSGDISANWITLRRQIAGGLSFGMSGFPYWTTDIGGFFRPADQYTSAAYHELLIRWFQFGAFCPIFRIHGYQSATEMWNYGPEVEQILTQYDKLRYRLLPYIYSAAWGVTNRGEAIMKALPFVYPNDSSVRNVSDQYLLGDALLVDPVTEPGATSRSVVLPAGDNWIDFWTGKAYPGGQTIVADAPLDRIPLLVREGSIVPMGPVIQSASGSEDPLEIRVYGGKDADFLLYQDAGDGYAYEHGARATIRFHWDNYRKKLTIGREAGAFPGMLTIHTFHIVFVRQGRGIGMGSDSGFDRSITYTGHAMKIDLDGLS